MKQLWVLDYATDFILILERKEQADCMYFKYEEILWMYHIKKDHWRKINIRFPGKGAPCKNKQNRTMIIFGGATLDRECESKMTVTIMAVSIVDPMLPEETDTSPLLRHTDSVIHESYHKSLCTDRTQFFSKCRTSTTHPSDYYCDVAEYGLCIDLKEDLYIARCQVYKTQPNEEISKLTFTPDNKTMLVKTDKTGDATGSSHKVFKMTSKFFSLKKNLDLCSKKPRSIALLAGWDSMNKDISYYAYSTCGERLLT
jgi:hypothetical protein